MARCDRFSPCEKNIFERLTQSESAVCILLSCAVKYGCGPYFYWRPHFRNAHVNYPAGVSDASGARIEFCICDRGLDEPPGPSHPIRQRQKCRQKENAVRQHDVFESASSNPKKH